MITSHPSAPLGSVTTLSKFTATSFLDTDAILCRNTAPLVAFAFGLITRDRGCCILGRDIGANLANAIKKTKTTDLTECVAALDKQRRAEFRRALGRDNAAAAAAVTDKFDCLALLTSNAESVEDVLDRINTLFVAPNGARLLTLATIHKSKGLEWSRVFILDRHLMPSKWATLEWQRVQERNLEYVAVTRARLDLVNITSEGWED